MTRILSTVLLGSLLATPALAREVEVTLSGSRASMLRQNRIAKQEDFSFLRTPTQVRRFVDDGRLVLVPGGADYEVADAAYPFARPVVLAFVERLAGDYRTACGERLVVTSLTRPTAKQPRNASPLSVHPAGMAVDLRVSNSASCRRWLNAELLALENRGLIDATLEKRPPHYHVAVFPEPYADYENVMRADSAQAHEAAYTAIEAAVAARAAEIVASLEPEPVQEEVVAAQPPVLLRIAALFARLLLPLV